MRRILFITNDSWFLVSHRLELVRTMRAAGWQCAVLAKGDKKVIKITETGTVFFDWPVSPRGKSPIGELVAIWHLIKVIRSWKPDIVHLITIKPVLYGGLACRLLRVPGVVYAISGLGAVFSGTSVLSRIFRAGLTWIYRYAVRHPNSVVIFQNHDDKAALLHQLGVKDLPVALIRGSGVDLSRFTVQPEPAGVCVVTLAARLLKDKGIPEFVEAANILHSRNIDAVFQIAGDDKGAGNPAAFTDAELAELKKFADVKWLGNASDIPDLFAASHLIVLPSHREGLPKVLVEAGAAGRAVITTDVPGCRDAITPGVTGVLVPVRNANALADAIAVLIADPEMRSRMGIEGRSLVEREMQVSAIAQQHRELYERLLA